MTYYIYQAESLCEDCGAEEVSRLRQHHDPPSDPDSDEWPIACPNRDESDSPVHCGACGVLIDEIALTSEGVRYVLDALEEHLEGDGDPNVLDEWADYLDSYGLDAEETAIVDRFRAIRAERLGNVDRSTRLRSAVTALRTVHRALSQPIDVVGAMSNPSKLQEELEICRSKLNLLSEATEIVNSVAGELDQAAGV